MGSNPTPVVQLLRVFSSESRRFSRSLTRVSTGSSLPSIARGAVQDIADAVQRPGDDTTRQSEEKKREPPQNVFADVGDDRDNVLVLGFLRLCLGHAETIAGSACAIRA